MKADYLCAGIRSADACLGEPRRYSCLRVPGLLMACMLGVIGCGSADASSPASQPGIDGAVEASAEDAGSDEEVGEEHIGNDADAALPTLVGDPKFKTHIVLDDMRWTKAPQLATHGDSVFLVGTVGSTAPAVDGKAIFRAKASGATSFGSITPLGTARGSPEYASTAIHVEADGSIDVAFIDETDGADRPTTITRRRRSTEGKWSDGDVVVSDSLVRKAVALTGSGNALDLFWTEQERVWHASAAGGAPFGAPSMAIDAWVGTEPAASTLADGRAAFLVAADSAWVGIENGDQFAREEINGLGDGLYLAGPSLSAAPDGRTFAAFRAVEGGIYVAERSPEGEWELTNPFHDVVRGPASVVADQYGYLHLFWADGDGVSYAYRSRDKTWSAAAHATICDYNYGVWGAITWGPSVLRAHVVTEDSPGGADENRRVSYAMFEVAVQ
jgi:hypothetical protein